MRGDNPIRPPEAGDGSQLQVQDMFATLQGEGPNAGTPAVFVRLGGCNLACNFCDTEFESFKPMALDRMAERVRMLAGEHIRLVVITGGEPLRQNITPLCETLLSAGFRVQIETNGTLFRALPAEVEIICSPKATQGRYAPLRGDLLARLTALKFLVSAHRDDYREVADVGQVAHDIPVYVQPMDELDPAKNAANAAYAAQLAQAKGYRLSLQLHKILGIA